MKYINYTDFQLKNSAVSLGKFDGLHIGHRKLFDYTKEMKKEGLNAVVFSFLRPPIHLLKDKEINLIYMEDEKRKILEHMDMDVLVSYPFDKMSLSMEPEDFIHNILVGKLDAKVIAVGTDFRFGHNRKGNVDFLAKMAEKYGYRLQVFEKVAYKGDIVSSTRIRWELAEGNMQLAAELLGEPYSVWGEVVHGRKLGRTIGMPTTNIVPEQEKLLPPNGVYVSLTEIDGKMYPGISNVGVKPTVGEEENRLIETNIFDFSGDLYGKVLKVELHSFVRPEQKFASVEQLKMQMEKDTIKARNYFAKHSF